MKQTIIVKIALAVVIGWGWALNIISLVDLGLDQALTIEGVLRIVGVPLAPLGAVLGYFV